MSARKSLIAAGTIVAVDLGQFKCVACSYSSDDAAYRFHSFSTSRENLTKLLTRIQPEAVVIEACALAGWVSDLCGELGVACHVANTASEAWKFKHTKRKTDRDDALRLAQLFVLGQLPEVRLPSKSVREWRGLIAGRQRLVTRRVSLQNRIRSLLVEQGLPAPPGAKAWSAAGLQALHAQAKPLAECEPEELWRGLLELALTEYQQMLVMIDQVEKKLSQRSRSSPGVSLLETTPGVGPRTAEAVVAYLDDPHRFETGKQVSAYAGMVPRQYQSGETDQRGRISKRGPKLLRKLLVECAWCLLRYNTWAKSVWLRLTKGGKVRRKQAIVALARKLLVRLWAMLRDGTPWRAEPVAQPAPAPA
jgi:transposase